MDALVSHAQDVGHGASRRLKLAAAAADLMAAAALAVAATVSVLAAVIALAMSVGGGRLPSSPVEAALYLAFPVFEFLVFTPVWMVAPATAAGAALLFWLARMRVLPFRSPGMLLTGTSRRTLEG